MNKKLDDIKIPSNIDNIIDSAIDKAVEDKLKLKKKNKRKVIGTVAASLGLFLTLGITSPAFASNIPVIGSVFEEIQDKIGFSGRYTNYATGVNQTVYDNGIGMTLSEILCDGQSLYVTYVVESEEPFKYTKYKYDPVRDYDITEETANRIVGTQLLDESYSKVSFSNNQLDNTGVAGLEGRYIDDHTFVGVERYNLYELFTEIPDEFEFEVKYKRLVGIPWRDTEKDQVFKGNWNFKVPVKVDKSITEEIIIDNINDDGLGVSKIMITPFEIRIETVHNKNEAPLSYYTHAKDENGDSLSLSSQNWYDDKSLTILERKEKDLGKITIELYREILKEISKDDAGNSIYEDVGSDVFYSVDVDIK